MHHPRFSLPPQNTVEVKACQDILLQKNTAHLSKELEKKSGGGGGINRN